ncbi:hypothetical protein BDV96DRAFT_482763 [Lophiotrema nucula]|uniref:Rhodopsin domain-containing protein n=1 Tax=Lophiotrema nucula TaxID=690887 RepID=A0A6A5ZSF1_9PLEO|nr:hypothetical protein BDV96DRAFT_482763 [Lophiotrema nucula]
MADVAPYQFSKVTPDDHSGLIYIAAFLGFTYSNITFITRCCIKWQVFGFDDWGTCAAQIGNAVQFTLLLLSLSAGLGRTFDTLTGDQYSRMASLQYGYQIAFYLSLGLSKCAAVLLIQRLFTRDAKKFWLICNIVTGITLSWTLVAAILVSVGCSPKSTFPATAADVCLGLPKRYEAVVITDALTDLLLVIVPAYLVWQLQMSASLKLQVIAVFAFRLPLIVFSAFVLTNFNRSLHGRNPGVERTPAIIFQQSQLCFSLIAGTVPCLKSFIRSFDTGSGVKAGFTSAGYGSSGYGRGESYRMQSLSAGSAIRSQTEDRGDVRVNAKPFEGGSHGSGRTRGDSIAKVTSTAYSPHKGDDAASNDSQELFIRRDVQWEVRSENLRGLP